VGGYQSKQSQTKTMSRTTIETHETKPSVRARFILPLQSTGRVGKSTTAEAIIAWANFANIEWLGLDADSEHKSLSQAFPSRVTLLNSVTTEPDEFKRLVSLIARRPAPLLLADFPAQATSFLLAQVETFGVLDTLEASGIRPTLLLFPADDHTAQVSLANVVRAFGARADYILVRNPARFSTRQFDESKLADRLAEFGAKSLILPALTKSTLEDVARYSRSQRRIVPLAEAAPHLADLLSKAEAQGWINKVFLQFQNTLADYLLPDVTLITKRLANAADKFVPAPIDELDPLGF
jgi:hypothetical protein